jgi:hypothetical protein
VLELDFAILHMLDHKRQGLAARKYFLDRLAPVFFSPRVEHLIDFGDLGLKGCNVLLPLGESNWQQLEADMRGYMWKKSEGILQEYAVTNMAADRRLKKTFEPSEAMFPLVFGDHFIKALAAVLVRHTLERRSVDKLVLVGNMAELLPLLDHLSDYRLPISVQNQQPGRGEITAQRLLYEKGLAISNSYISPENWTQGDLIILFQPGYKRMALAAPGAFYLELNDESQDLAPSLEHALARAGMDHRLPILAPILESIMYTKAGISQREVEKNDLNYELKSGTDLEALIDIGEQLGVWDPFRHSCG